MVLWRTAKNAGTTLTGQAWASLLGLLTLPIMVRSFGAEAFGLLSLSLTVVGVASVCDLGIGRALSKCVAEENDPARTDRNIHSALSIALSLAAVFTAAFALATPLLVRRVFRVQADLATQATLVFLFTAAGLPAALIRILLDGVLIGKQRIATLSVVNASAATLKIGLGLLVAIRGGPVSILVLTYCAISYVHMAVLGWLCFGGLRPIASFGFAWDLEVLKKLMRLGGLSTVATASSYIFLYLDRWIIAAFLPISVLGYYAMAFDIAYRQNYISNAIGQAFFPVFSQSATISRGALTNVYLHASKMTLVATTGMAVILASFSPTLLNFWVSPDTGRNAGLLLSILAIAVALSCYFNMPATVLLAGSRRPEIIAGLFVVAAVAHLTISFVTIRWLGATGVALGFGVGYLAALWISHRWLIRHLLAKDTLKTLYGCLSRCWTVAVVVGVSSSYLLMPVLSSTIRVLAAMAAAYGVYITAAMWVSYSESERSRIWEQALSTASLRTAADRV